MTSESEEQPIDDPLVSEGDGRELSQCEAEVAAERQKLGQIQREVDDYKRAISRHSEQVTEGQETLDAMRKKPTKKGVMSVVTGNLRKVDFSNIEKFVATEITPFDVAAQVNYTGSYNMTLGKNLKPSTATNWALPIGTIVMVFFIILVIFMVARGMF